MKRAHLFSSLSAMALMTASAALAPADAAPTAACTSAGECLYGLVGDGGVAIAPDDQGLTYLNAFGFQDGTAGNGSTLVVGDGFNINSSRSAATGSAYDYLWSGGAWADGSTTFLSGLAFDGSQAVLTATDNSGTLTFLGNSHVFGHVGSTTAKLKQINAGANGTEVQFDNGKTYVNTLNFVGNGEMRFGRWSNCSYLIEPCSLTADKVITAHNGQGILSMYYDSDIGVIGTPTAGLFSVHLHEMTLTLKANSYMGQLMYNGTVDVSGFTNPTLGFSTLVTGANLLTPNIKAGNQDLNIATGFVVAPSNASASTALQTLWQSATAANPTLAAADLAVRLGAGINKTEDYLTYGTLKLAGHSVQASPLDRLYVSDGILTPAQSSALLHANGQRVRSTSGNWTFLLGDGANPGTSASLLFQRTSNAPHRDILDSGNANSRVFAGVANALDTAANAYYSNPNIGYSTGFKSVLAKLDLMSFDQRTQAMQQMVDMSVNNSVTSTISGVGMEVSQAIDSRKADAMDVNLGINSGDDTSIGPRNNVWIQAIGSWNEQGRRDNVDGYSANTYGTALGLDRMIRDGTNLGVALHYANTRVDGKGVFSSNNTKINSYGITLYGQQSLTQKLVLSGRLGYAYHDVRANRSSTLLGERASGSWGGNQIDAAAKLGYTVTLPQDVAVTPNLGLAYTYLHEGSYTETGDGMALKVGSRATSALLLGGGIKGSKIFTTEDKITIVPELHGGIHYDALASSIDTTAQFVGGGASFITRNIKPDPWVFNVGAGVKVVTTDKLAISVNYDAAFRDQFVGHTASLKAKMTF